MLDLAKAGAAAHLDVGIPEDDNRRILPDGGPQAVAHMQVALPGYKVLPRAAGLGSFHYRPAAAAALLRVEAARDEHAEAAARLKESLSVQPAVDVVRPAHTPSRRSHEPTDATFGRRVHRFQCEPCRT